MTLLLMLITLLQSHLSTIVTNSYNPHTLKLPLEHIILHTHYIVAMLKHHNGTAEYPHIPERAFLFVPRYSQDPALRDDYKIGEGKKIRRLLFEGWAQRTYTPYEKEKLEEFN